MREQERQDLRKFPILVMSLLWYVAMALKSDIDYDPFGIKAAEQVEAEKKRQAWLDEFIEMRFKDSFEGKPNNDRTFFVKRRDLMDIINTSGVLDGIRESCSRSELLTRVF